MWGTPRLESSEGAIAVAGVRLGKRHVEHIRQENYTMRLFLDREVDVGTKVRVCAKGGIGGEQSRRARSAQPVAPVKAWP